MIEGYAKPSTQAPSILGEALSERSHAPERRSADDTRGEYPYILTKAMGLAEAFGAEDPDILIAMDMEGCPMICMNPGCGYITKRDDATDRECHICHSQSMVTAKELQRKLNA